MTRIRTYILTALTDDSGATDPGSLALGVIAGLVLGYLIWGPR